MENVYDLEAKVGRLVREARLGRDMSQVELAHQSNVTVSTIQNLERGKGAQLKTFLMVLRSLERLDIIDSLDERYSEPSPMELLRKSQNKPARPQRASRKA